MRFNMKGIKLKSKKQKVNKTRGKFCDFSSSNNPIDNI